MKEAISNAGAFFAQCPVLRVRLSSLVQDRARFMPQLQPFDGNPFIHKASRALKNDSSQQGEDSF